MTLSEMIERHIEGTGNGFEIDDIVSSGKFPDEVVEAIANIEKKYRYDGYTLGISNPDSFEELLTVAQNHPGL